MSLRRRAMLAAMRPRDTSPRAQQLMDEYYRGLSTPKKAELIRDARRTARSLQLARLRFAHPDESEERLELRLAGRWLGTELFERFQAWQRERGIA